MSADSSGDSSTNELPLNSYLVCAQINDSIWRLRIQFDFTFVFMNEKIKNQDEINRYTING